MDIFNLERKPTSPGEILQEEYLTPLGLTQRQLADHIGVEYKTINRIVNQRSSITAQTAVMLASAFGTSPRFWLNAQIAMDLWKIKESNMELPGKLVA